MTGGHADTRRESHRVAAGRRDAARVRDDPVIIQSLWARKPLDRMCVHAGDGQTYLSGLDSMS